MQSSLALLGLVSLLLSPCARANYRCYAFGDGVTLRENGSTNTALCADDSYDLFYKGTRVQRNMAVCESRKDSKGWLTVAWPGEPNYQEQVLTRDSETPAEFECRKAPTPCSFHPAEWLQFDAATKTLTCTNSDNTLRAIKHSSKLFASFRCGRQGRSDVWKANADLEWKETVGEYIVEASPTLNVTCAEYCEPSGDGIDVRRFGNLVELSCADPTLGLSYNGNSSTKTRCSLEKGWTERDNSISEDPKSRVNFKCSTACTLQSNSGIHVDHHVFSCSKNDSHFLNLINFRDQIFDVIQCHPASGWHEYGNSNWIAGSYSPLNATCVKYCSWSGDDIVADRKLYKLAPKIEVTCKDPGFGVSYRSSSPRRSLQCSTHPESGGWREEIWGNDSKIDGASAHLELTCVKYPPYCDMASVEGFEYDRKAKKLSCAGGAMHAIEFNSEPYSSFKCDEKDGWAGKKSSDKNNFRDEYGYRAVDGSPQNFKCVKYCAATGEGTKVDYNEYYEQITVTCQDQGLLFYNNTRANRDKVDCTVAQGWKGYGTDDYWSRAKLELNHASTVEFECKPDPSTTAKPTTRQRVWRPANPTEEPLANAEAQTLTIICASIGGIVLLVIVLIIVICVLKRQRQGDSGIRNNIPTDRSETRDGGYNDVARSARSER